MDNHDNKGKLSGWADFVAPKVGKNDLKRSAAQLKRYVSDEKRIFVPAGTDSTHSKKKT